VNVWLRQIPAAVHWNRDSPRLYRVLVLRMTASLRVKIPAILLNDANDFFGFQAFAFAFFVGLQAGTSISSAA